MLVFDFLICNSDRHFNNFGFIRNIKTNEYTIAPLFDHGLSFLGVDGGKTNTQIEMFVRKYKAMPFSRNPVKNIIDIREAQEIVKQFVKHANDTCGGLANLAVNQTHKAIVQYRIKQLMSYK